MCTFQPGNLTGWGNEGVKVFVVFFNFIFYGRLANVLECKSSVLGSTPGLDQVKDRYSVLANQQLHRLIRCLCVHSMHCTCY